MVKFYDEIKKYSPFFMMDLAKKLLSLEDYKVKRNGKIIILTEDEAISKVYKKIYMQIRYYHKDEWDCKEIKNGLAGRSPLRCTYIGDND